MYIYRLTVRAYFASLMADDGRARECTATHFCDYLRKVSERICQLSVILGKMTKGVTRFGHIERKVRRHTA